MIAVFDIGRTNKKFLVFDSGGKIAREESVRFPEIPDEDGWPSDDILLLTGWMKDTLRSALADPSLNIQSVNVSAYGASFVHIDKDGRPLTPLYSYLKPFPESLKEQFFRDYGPQKIFSAATASPYLGMLNSGLQIYRLKYEQPDLFSHIRYSLHLPQYLSFVLGGFATNEISSTGCHTGLWDFENNELHSWVKKENIAALIPPLHPTNQSKTVSFEGHKLEIGTGIHDSSAALVPYLLRIPHPFILLSTGTWSIAMNPFNREPLTTGELDRDVLAYLTYAGAQVKSSRLFLGNEHDYQLERISAHFGVDASFSRDLKWDEALFANLAESGGKLIPGTMEGTGPEPLLKNGNWVMEQFSSPEKAYYRLMWDLTEWQVLSLKLASGSAAPAAVYIDGGFSRNELFTRMLARRQPDTQWFVAEIGQATALGAALVIQPEPARFSFPLTFRRVIA
ncbi:MAG: FGGY family carbohydrate kinase [Bacteroidia bacterium]